METLSQKEPVENLEIFEEKNHQLAFVKRSISHAHNRRFNKVEKETLVVDEEDDDEDLKPTYIDDEEDDTPILDSYAIEENDDDTEEVKPMVELKATEEPLDPEVKEIEDKVEQLVDKTGWSYSEVMKRLNVPDFVMNNKKYPGLGWSVNLSHRAENMLEALQNYSEANRLESFIRRTDFIYDPDYEQNLIRKKSLLEKMGNNAIESAFDYTGLVGSGLIDVEDAHDVVRYDIDKFKEKYTGSHNSKNREEFKKVQKKFKR